AIQTAVVAAGLAVVGSIFSVAATHAASDAPWCAVVNLGMAMLVGIAAIAASRNACRMSSPATAGHAVQPRTGRNRRRRFQQSGITDVPSDFLAPAAKQRQILVAG